MPADERQTILRVLTRLDSDIAQRKEKLATAQSGWCEDRFQTIKMTHEIGALQRERTNLAERLRQLQTAGEDAPRGSSSVFTGSSF
jgi:hypothetical protein